MREIISKDIFKAYTLKDPEVKKSKAFVMGEIVDYIPNAIVSKTIIRKTTGTVNVVSFDSGEAWAETTSPFDTFVQVIDGTAEIVINHHPYSLEIGRSIIIPANVQSSIKANVRFKILSTTIKSEHDR